MSIFLRVSAPKVNRGQIVNSDADMNLHPAVSNDARVKSRWRPAAIILAVSLVLSFPLFRDGLPLAHDTEEHLERYVCFAAQIANGEVYPRWLANANGGLGSPVMFVYAPLAYYVPTLLRPLLHFPVDGAKESRELGVSMWLALAASGLAAFLWLKSFVSREAVATFGAVLYMAIPYHFAIDLYTRAAIAEMWAFALMPLILYFEFTTIRTRSRFAMAGFAASYGLLICTHLLTTLIFTPIVIAAPLFIAKSGSRWPSLIRISLLLALGVGLSAVYLAPALWHEKDVSPDRLAQFRPTLSYGRNFMALSRSGADPNSRGDFVWKVSWITLSTAAAAICAFALQGRWKKRNPQDYLWAAVAAVSLVMMFPISKFLWAAIPQLAALQFPYRFNTLLSIATVALLASAADSLTRPFRAWRLIAASGIVAMLVLWAATDAGMVMRLRPGKLPSQPLLSQTPLSLDVLLPGWSQAKNPQFLRQAGILELSRQAAVHGEGATNASLERPNAREIELTVDHSQGWVTLPLLFYPGWSAKSESGSKLNMRAVPDNGLVEVEIPAGHHRVQLVLPSGPMETIGIATTAGCFMLILVFLAGDLWRRRMTFREAEPRLAESEQLT
jgi:hypothetical protein